MYAHRIFSVDAMYSRLYLLAENYVTSGDLVGSMKVLGYNTSRQSLYRMKRQERFLQAVRDVCDEILRRALVRLASGEGKIAHVEAAKALVKTYCQPPPKKKVKQNQDTAW